MRFHILAAAIAAIAFADEVVENAEPALVDADEATLGDYYYDNIDCNTYSTSYYNYYYGSTYYSYSYYNLCNGNYCTSDYDCKSDYCTSSTC